MEIKLNNINFGEKLVKIDNDSVTELLEKLSLNDDSVILIGKDGKIYTKDQRIKEGDEINVVEVFSGG
ncbi:MAG: MoaD/ThiS family protein [Candidatus Parvarchaeota archaeon]|nr:MoaD/ThiS family protein [Candidatus Parvarchaeota archaeon]MCW1294735.1 MoaD/ThiS family protein [Candidatus Parvarchaeum tengchongense]MCW1295490.1 MoaD/ThiS family protein [Candidatus Parvarchaeum tengchongense]MCW1299091.1 MoaD/ThiS family protein [Candidatus Parvarchaeum tengchongense]MCW1311956.1 MoaD/ThiS family protein [Candidatus Parvarchaeum tengchongense]